MSEPASKGFITIIAAVVGLVLTLHATYVIPAITLRALEAAKNLDNEVEQRADKTHDEMKKQQEQQFLLLRADLGKLATSEGLKNVSDRVTDAQTAVQSRLDVLENRVSQLEVRMGPK